MDERTRERRRAARAAERRQRQRRRRVVAVGTLAGVIAAVALIVALTRGSTPRSRSSGGAAVAGHLRRSRRARTRGANPGGAAIARPGPPTGHPGNAAVPILMYHVIAAPPPGAPFPGLYVPRAEFAAQMAALARAGWHAVTLDELRANWTDGARLPSKPIVITFDNGYRSQYADALPVLRRLHWPAVENLQLAGLPPSQGGLTTDQVRALVHAGWELDTQGLSHADLVTLDGAQLRTQIADTRTTLRRRFHVPVRWFCYPSGHYDSTVIAAVRAAGFVGSTTVVPGWAQRSTDPYRLPRLRVLGGTSPAALLKQIATARTAAPPPASYGQA